MTRDRSTGQYEPKPVESAVRAMYESRTALQKHDFIYGSQFSTGSLIQDLPAGAVTDLLIRNPQDSGKYLVIDPDYTVNGRATAQKFINVDVIDIGEVIPVAQQRSDFDQSTVSLQATINATVDTTVAREFPERLATTSSGGQAGGAIVEAEEVFIAPGDNVAIELTNISNNAIDATLYIEATEIPEIVVNTISEPPLENQ